MAIAITALTAAAAAWSGSLQSGISFFVERPLGAGEQVRFRFAQGGLWREARPRAGDRDRPPYDYRLLPFAEVQVQAALVRSGKTLAKVRIKLPAEADRRYMVHAAVQRDDPTAACMGCSKAVSAPVAGNGDSGARKLWLYWSFNGISRPIAF